jgi:hypothetical protein
MGEVTLVCKPAGLRDCRQRHVGLAKQGLCGVYARVQKPGVWWKTRRFAKSVREVANRETTCLSNFVQRHRAGKVPGEHFLSSSFLPRSEPTSERVRFRLHTSVGFCCMGDERLH